MEPQQFSKYKRKSIIVDSLQNLHREHQLPFTILVSKSPWTANSLTRQLVKKGLAFKP